MFNVLFESKRALFGVNEDLFVLVCVRSLTDVINLDGALEVIEPAFGRNTTADFVAVGRFPICGMDDVEDGLGVRD